MTEIKLAGTCAPQFEKVRDAFAQEFADGNELGASLCITLEDEAVVDLWVLSPKCIRNSRVVA